MKNIKLFTFFAVLLLSAFVSTAWAFKAEAPVSYSVSYGNNIISITGGGTTTSWTITSTNGFSYWKTDDSHALANGMSVKIDGKVLVNPTYCVTWGNSATFTFTAPDSIAITGVTFKFANTVVAASSTSEPGTTFTVTLDAEKSFTGFEVTYGKIKGKCGTSATWSLSMQNKKYTALTIGGSGAMSDYDHDESSIWRTTAPWGWDLTSVTIGNSITSIGNYAFIGSQQLSSLTIGKSVTSIGDAAFDHCDALTEVTLPASVNSLGDGAFKNCVGLTRVNIKKTYGLVSLGKNAFNGTALQYIVALTPALAVQYQSASNWSTHKAKLRVVLDDAENLHNYLFTVTGTADDAAYEIATETDLRNLSAAVNEATRAISEGKTFRQTASIDLSSGGDFTPIGNSVDLFKGVYDGQGYAITGLSAKSNQYYVGLFGKIQGASIRNIVLVSPSVRSTYKGSYTSSVGAIVGYSRYTNTVENCYVVSPTFIFDNTSGKHDLGAIAGYIDRNLGGQPSITNSYYYDNDHDYRAVNGDGTLTNVGRARIITAGKNVTIAAPSATEGFSYGGKNYYREGLDLTLGYSGTLPTGTHVVYSANGTAISGDTYTVNSTDGDAAITADNFYYSVIPGNALRVTTTPAITYENVDYYSSGTTITVEPINASSIVEGVGGVSGYTIAADKRSFSFTMPSKGVEISATTSEVHTVNITGGVIISDAYATIDNVNYYKKDSVYTLTVANKNEIIDEITGVEATINNDKKSATFTMPTGDVEISAATSEVHTVNITGGVIISDAYATIDNVKYCKPGDTYTLTVANENEIIDAITGVEATINNDRKTATFTMRGENVTITATTISISDIHTVNITGGVIISDAYATIDNVKYYKPDSVYTLTVANENEIIDEITGVEATINNDKKSATFTMPSEDVTISAKTFKIWGDGDGSKEKPYTISRALELDSLSERVNAGNSYEGKYFKLIKDIKFDYEGKWEGALTNTENLAGNFIAIGTNDKPFMGIFNGKGHTIRGIRINEPGKDYQGLFGYLGEGAVVDSVKLADVVILGGSSTGGIAGYNNFGEIRYCTVDSVLIKGDGKYYGGVVGWNAGEVSNNTSSATLTSTSGADFGGVVGYNSSDGTVSNNTSSAKLESTRGENFGGVVGWNAGEVSNNTSSATLTSTSGADFGGVVGYNSSRGTVSNNTSSATLTGDGKCYGGVVGGSYGEVSNNTSSATLESTSGSRFGGVVGYNGGRGTVSNNTSSATLTSTRGEGFGGVVGENYNDGTIENNLAIGVTIPAVDYHGAIVGYNKSSSLSNNFYTACTVGSDKNVSNVGVGNNGYVVAPHDVTDKNGAVGIGFTAPVAVENLVYNKSSQDLVTEGYSDFGTLLYSLDGKNYSTAIPSAVDAEKYTVYYRVDKDNDNVIVARTIEVSIAPKIVLASGAVQVLQDQNGKRAEIDGAYKTDKKVVEITDVKVDSVVFKRTFTKGAFSTIMLPFSINVNKVSGADFYQITDIKVEINDNGGKKDTIWGPVTISVVEDEITANTPYLLGPTETSLSFDIGEEGVVLNTSEMKPYTFTKEGVQWEFRGTYHYFDFGKDSTQLIKKSYGFAAKDQDNGVGVGDFRWTSDQSFILPMRCYLVYNRLKDNENNNGNGDDGEPNDDGEPKPQMLNAPSRSIHASIPETLEVVIVDEKGGKTVIGTLNTRSGELRLKPRPKHTYDLKGRRVNATRKAKGVYVER